MHWTHQGTKDYYFMLYYFNIKIILLIHNNFNILVLYKPPPIRL